MAFGAIRAAERLGLSVPGDLSVIGVDGHEYAEMFGLTTIEQYPGEQGRLAVDVVLHLLGEDLADPLPDSGAPLPTRLVVRSSTTTRRAEGWPARECTPRPTGASTALRASGTPGARSAATARSSPSGAAHARRRARAPSWP